MKITIHNLDEFEPQDVFNQIAFHMLFQNEKSMDDSDQCLYRGPEGKKCAAGILIPDEDYDVEMEDTNWSYMANIEGKVTAEHSSLIRYLQHVHDYYPVEQWKYKLSRIAKMFDLNDAVVKYTPVNVPEPESKSTV